MNTRVKIDERGTRWYRLKRQSRWKENFWPVSSSRVPKLLFNYKIKTLRLRGSWLPYRISQKFKSMRRRNYSKRSERLLPRKKRICFRAFKLWHSERAHYLSNAKLPMRRRWRHWASLLRTMKELRKRTIFWCSVGARRGIKRSIRASKLCQRCNSTECLGSLGAI